MDRRSRSATTVSQRPPSRESTTSIQSAMQPRPIRAGSLPQHSQAHAQYGHHPMATAGQPQHYNNFTVQMQGIPPQQYPQHGLPVQPEYNAQHQQHNRQQMQTESTMYHQHSLQYPPRPHSVDQYSTLSIQPSNSQQQQASMDSEDTKKRSGAASTQSNEKELRQSLDANQHRTLKDVAKEVIDSERTSRAEKTKQLFAMLWLRSSCETAKTSVPRSRVYAAYADRCATERVQPLNPASFGKLVRIIFKGIQTRRLGVRGESKYHYVDLALKSEQPESEIAANRPPGGAEPHSPRMSIDFTTMPRFTADQLADHFDGSPLGSPVHMSQRDDGSTPHGAVFAEPHSATYRSAIPYSQTYSQRLQFPPPNDEEISMDVELPSLWPYAPERADEDAADALVALYRSHCTSLIEYFKKCKEKQFLRTYSSFQGTLTVPVQKLLTSPSMAAWIRECDYYMYQKMLAFLARIALGVLPQSVILFFHSISSGLHGHITKTFQGMPHHVLEARLEPATLFAELVNRVIKVNNAAHAASQVLELSEHRELLHQEWTQYINIKRLMEGEVPGCGFEQTYKILTEDMTQLLTPHKAPPVYEDGLPYEDPNASAEEADNYIERIAMLLRSLPQRFPHARAGTIVDCVKKLSTGAMREFTMQGANSFHAWWIVKVFIDEYSQWLVTSGGFLAHRPDARLQASPALSHTASSLINGIIDGNAEQSRRSSVAPADNGADQDSMVYIPSANNSRKRRSEELEDPSPETTETTNKKPRTSPSEPSQPHFEQQHPSFATTSFGSVAIPPLEPQPATPHETEFEDSGIGLGLLSEAAQKVIPPSRRKQPTIDRAPFVEQADDFGVLAV